jgi:hypothetical protein
VSEWDNPVVLKPLRPVCGIEILDPAITALLIMGGATCKFVTNRWVIRTRDGHRGAIHFGATFEEWVDALSHLLPPPPDRDV